MFYFMILYWCLYVCLFYINSPKIVFCMAGCCFCVLLVVGFFCMVQVYVNPTPSPGIDTHGMAHDGMSSRPFAHFS